MHNCIVLHTVNLGDEPQVNEKPEMKIKLFKEIGYQIEGMFDEYLRNANASDAVNVLETLASINESIVNHMSRGFHVF